MSKVGEFELIRRIAAAFRHPERSASCHPEACPELAEGPSEGSTGVVGIGDDCAVLPQRDGVDTLVTTDLLIEDRHFLLADVSPEDLGWKSAAVNISDIAAMGGRPTASFLSIALPKTLRVRNSGVPYTPVPISVDGGVKNGVPYTPAPISVDGGVKNGVPYTPAPVSVDGGVKNSAPSTPTPVFLDGGVKNDVPYTQAPISVDGGVNNGVPYTPAPISVDGGVKNSAPSTPTPVSVDGGVKNGVPYAQTPISVDGGTEESRTEGGERADGVAEWVERFIAGYRELSDRFGVPLLGGDTSASPDKLFVNVTVLGECPHGQAIMRSGARPGDLICVTGTLGDSAAGLKLILERTPDNQDSGSPAFPQQQVAGCRELRASRSSLPPLCGGPLPLMCPRVDTVPAAPPPDRRGAVMPDLIGHLIDRHYRPMPRVLEGQALAAVPGVHAMMDISDGIASDLRHILEASGRAVTAGGQSSKVGVGIAGVPEEVEGQRAAEGQSAGRGLGNAGMPSEVEGQRVAEGQSAERGVGNDGMPGVVDNGVAVGNGGTGKEVPGNEEPGKWEAGRVGAEIDLRTLPLSEELREVCAERGWDPMELAVSGGEDYELLFTVAPEALPAARRAIASAVAATSLDPAVAGSRSCDCGPLAANSTVSGSREDDCGPRAAGSAVSGSRRGDCDPQAANSAVSGSREGDYDPLAAGSAVSGSRETDCDPLTVIGRVTEGGGIRWIGGERDDYQGFTHF